MLGQWAEPHNVTEGSQLSEPIREDDATHLCHLQHPLVRHMVFEYL